MTTAPLTGAAVIAAAWPARYYAAYDTTATGLTKVTALYDVQSVQTVVQNLPAAATMIALTEDQWALTQGAQAIWVQSGVLLYPARYYAAYDTTAAQPTSVTGWYDTWTLSSVTSVPVATALIAVSSQDWADTKAFRLPTGRGVQDGKIIDYTPPAPPVPLATQATNALTAAASATWANYGSMGVAVPQAWITYQTALKAIADGTDTASTTLPAEPAV
ncbi:hypothetical protein [Acetobacter cerevisiae]|uniref:hypothetical protein n=1 Tax=Acetobacter cerevisiae TaxID=178900 RepID=UPI0020A1EE30|nr:hypothetical protein [Acetobacter cerevisiae]MCP1270889.1 hypothetical protein [Acetobacter cerevisiae]MCP1278880.1 hypothetical protein [Acetobacter cerevisiae]